MKLKVVLDFKDLNTIEQCLERIGVIAQYVDIAEEYTEEEEKKDENGAQPKEPDPFAISFDLEIHGDTYKVKDELKNKFKAWWEPTKKLWFIKGCDISKEQRVKDFLREAKVVNRLIRVNEVKVDNDKPF